MNRKNLTAAVLAGLAGVAGIAGTAQAVNMNPDGLGQVLIYPYYTTNDNNLTALSVVNTTDNAKAVKVRFLEGFNSREVLDFNLYMSEWDVWTAGLYQAAEDDTADEKPNSPSLKAGYTYLKTYDSTCTVPYLYGNGKEGLNDDMKVYMDELGYFGHQEFLDLAYTGRFADGGPTSIGRAAEGHFEVIEMGTLTGEAADNVRHASGLDGEPEDCRQLENWWTDFGGTGSGDDGLWYQEADAKDDCVPFDPTGDDVDFATCQADSYTTRNSGGLFGGAAVINVMNATMFSYNAQALQGFDDTDDGIHFIPGTIYPSLNTGSVNTSWVFFGVPQNQAVNLRYENTVDAVSSVFMHDTVLNEYVVESSLNAGTEWVVTFPTKNFYVDQDRMCEVGLLEGSDCALDDNGDFVNDIAREPFGHVFAEEDDDGNRLCEVVGLRTWDREENTVGEDPTDPNPVRPPVVSPSLPVCDVGNDPRCTDNPEAIFQLCTEVNVLRFGERSVFGTPEVDGQSLLYTVEDEFESGWGRMTFLGGLDSRNDTIDDEGLLGLPVTGFAAYVYENGFLEGPNGTVNANYGGLFGHKGNVRSLGGAGGNDAEIDPFPKQ